jgi:hypothetical protein
VTWTTRLRKDAALFELPPPRTGRRGRPRVKGNRLPPLATLAASATFTPVTVHRYGRPATVRAAAFTCLWHGVFGARPTQVVLVREDPGKGYDLAPATTDLAASPAQVIGRYASRWSIEVAVQDAKQVFGAGQARNRLATAVHHTIPFTLACQTIAITWYATAGHHPADVAEHRARAPRYTTKAEPSTADMIAKLRRVLIVAKYRPVHPRDPTPAESTPSGWPGKTPRHNCESRDLRRSRINQKYGKPSPRPAHVRPGLGPGSAGARRAGQITRVLEFAGLSSVGGYDACAPAPAVRGR